MRVYSKWHVSMITIAVTLFYTVPLVFAVSYTFNLERFMTFELKLLIALGTLIVVAIISSLVLTIRYRAWKAIVELQYRKEFAYLLISSGFGFLGLTVIYIEFGGNADYTIHLMIGLFILNYYAVNWLGKRVFNIQLFGLR